MAAAAAITPTAVFASSPSSQPSSIDDLGLAGFAALLNTTFLALPDSDRAVPMTLVEALPHRARIHGPDASHDRFSLLFRGTKSQALTQDTYWFDHPKLGRFQMFIARVGRTDQEHSIYEAVFSRPVAGASDRAEYSS